MDFAREKSLLFDRWCSASKESTFESLRELFLLEDFKNCLPEHIIVYLNEQAAVLADEFALTHKAALMRENVPRQSEKPIQSSFHNSFKPERPKQSFYGHKTSHLIAECDAFSANSQCQNQKVLVSLELFLFVPLLLDQWVLTAAPLLFVILV